MRKNIFILTLSIFSFLMLYGCSSKESDIIDIKKETDISNKDDVNTTQEESEEIIKVYITGAIKSPGVYEAKLGDRVEDIVNKAGGLLEDADIININLAAKISDEETIYIPKNGEQEAAKINTSNKSNLININTASKDELCTLTGIGSSRADDIISYRDANGGFKSIDELMNVPGIKDKTFNKIKDKITV